MDPITFSIIRHRLFRVVEEAVITLKHVSGSAITNEGHDLMVSLYRGRRLAADGRRRISASPDECGGGLQGDHSALRGANQRRRYLPAERSLYRGAAYLGHLSGLADPRMATC